MAFDDRSLERVRNAVRKVERQGNRRAVHWPKINQQSQTEWHGIIVNEGPDGEVDFADNRYWIRAAFVANNIQGVDLGDETEVQDHEREAISLSIEKDGSDYLEAWFSATHYGESSEETHDLPTDGTQYVLIKRTFDTSGCCRFFFWVKPTQAAMPIGGEFTAAGSKPATCIIADGGSRWNHTYQSSPIDTPGGTLYDSIMYGGIFYACGLFDLNGSSNVRLIKWNGTDWVELSGHDLDQIFTFELFGGLLYMGGQRLTAGDNVRTYDGSSFADATGAYGITTVYTLYNWNGTLIAGGQSAGGEAATYNSIQQLSGGSWGVMGSGVLQGVSPGIVRALLDWEGDLLVGGYWDDAGGVTTDNVAYWDGSWHAIGGGVGGASSIVKAFVIFNNEPYLGGEDLDGKLWHIVSGSWTATGDELSAALTNGFTGIKTLCNHPDGEHIVVGGDFQERTTAIYGIVPALTITKFGEIDNTTWEAETAYAVGDVVSAVAIGNVLHICTTAGTSGGSEPTWDLTIGDTTSDGTVTWTTIYRYNHKDYHGGIGGTNTNSSPGEAGNSVERVRSLTLPDADEARIVACGGFSIANQVYSPLVVGIRPGGYQAWGKGLRKAGTYIGVVRAVVAHGNGYIVAGLFDSALNRFGKGDSALMTVTNVVRYAAGGFTDAGERDADQYGGCLHGGNVILCGDTANAQVASNGTPATWEASHPYVEGETVIPTSPNGKQYVCITDGTSHATIEPTWPTVIDDTVLDNNGVGPLEWQCKATGWIPIGTNLDSGLYNTVASFSSTLWVGGTNLTISAGGPYDYATSTGDTNAAGNWTGQSITDILAINKFRVGDYGSGDRIILAGTTVSAGCIMVSSGGAFSELGGVGNRVSGDALDVIVWTDSSSVKHVTACGSIAVNGVSYVVADYEAGTWTGILDSSGVLGDADPTCFGTWAKMVNTLLAGGEIGAVNSEPIAANFVRYTIADAFQVMSQGGCSAGVRKIGPGTTAG